MLVSCSADTADDPAASTGSGGETILLISRESPNTASSWQQRTGSLTVQDGCILVSGSVVVMPSETRLVDDNRAIQLSEESEPISILGDATVEMTGNPFEFREMSQVPGIDKDNQARFDTCQQRVVKSDRASWWNVTALSAL